MSFEADLNWVLKIVFAKRMMRNAREQNLITPELFAIAGRSAIDATMAKIMFTDVCQTQHRNHAAGMEQSLGDATSAGLRVVDGKQVIAGVSVKSSCSRSALPCSRGRPRC